MCNRQSDLDLAIRAGAGERLAWLQLTARYRTLVARVMRKHAPSEAHIYDDLSQDVWLHISRYVGSFNPDKQTLDGWVYTLARTAVVDRYRHAAHAREVECSLDEKHADGRSFLDVLYIVPDLEDETEDRRNARALMRAVERLPRNLRIAVVLRQRGLNNAQIGTCIGRSRERVRQLEGKSEELIASIVAGNVKQRARRRRRGQVELPGVCG